MGLLHGSKLMAPEPRGIRTPGLPGARSSGVLFVWHSVVLSMFHQRVLRKKGWFRGYWLMVPVWVVHVREDCEGCVHCAAAPPVCRVKVTN